MKRRRFLGSISAGAAAAWARGPTGAAPAAPPDILFIITDQQSAGAMSCAGHRWMRTPNLDRLAARGVRFERSYCTYPLCSPSRAGLFTSRMPHEVGVNTNSLALPEDAPTLGSVLRAAGYDTAYAGKWHLPASYPAYSPRAGQRTIPGFDVLPMEGRLLDKDRVADGKGLTYDPRATDAAINFLKQPRARPFALVVSLLNPHDICEYPELVGPNPRLARRAEVPPPPANLAPVDVEPAAIRESRARVVGGQRLADWPEARWREMGAVYANLVEAADEQVGHVLAALEQSGRAANTLIVFTADHGELLGAHRLVHKMQFFEEAMAVPLIVCPPGRTAAAVDARHLVSGLDLMPTMLDYAGAAPPPGIRGLSLRPLIEGRDVAWRDVVAAEVGRTGPRWGRMVLTARHKYAVYAGGENPEMLFDRSADPGELRNLAADPSAKAVLADYRARLAEWRRQTSDPFEPAMPAKT